MKTSRSNRRMNFESMEKRELFAADLGMNLAATVEAEPASAPAEIDTMTAGEGGIGEQPVCYLKYKLDRAFIKSWSTSGDADDRPTEEVAFYYNKLAFNYGAQGVIDGQDFNVWRNAQQNTDGNATDEVFAEANQSESYLAYQLKDVIVTSYS